MARAPDTKICAACGRRMTLRRRWKDDWDQVRFCSARCRRRDRRLDEQLEAAILELCAARDPGATICPSEAARRVRSEGWRDLMEPVRDAARRLAHAGRLEILQRGRVVDAASIRGPVRLRLVR